MLHIYLIRVQHNICYELDNIPPVSNDTTVGRSPVQSADRGGNEAVTSAEVLSGVGSG